MKLTKEALLSRIREAYDEIGLKPIKYTFYDDSHNDGNIDYVCPVTALYCQRFIKERESWFQVGHIAQSFAYQFEVDRHWVEAFWHGVDGTGSYEFDKEEGYAYGQFVGKQLFSNETEAWRFTGMVDSSVGGDR